MWTPWIWRSFCIHSTLDNKTLDLEKAIQNVTRSGRHCIRHAKRSRHHHSPRDHISQRQRQVSQQLKDLLRVTRRPHWHFLKCAFGKSKGDQVPSESLMLTLGLRPLYETETQIPNTRLANYGPGGQWHEGRAWRQKKEVAGCQK